MKPAAQRLLLATAGAAFIGLLLFRAFSGDPDADATPTRPAPAPAIAGTSDPTTAYAPPPSDPVAPEPQPAAPGNQEAQPKRSHARLTIKAGQPIPELFPFQAERDRLISLATSYDPQKIPEIAPWLAHTDASVRDAARQALVQIGHASAIPHLEKAKQAAQDPTEAEIIQETIDFLSLPHVIDVLSLSANANRQQQP